MTQPSSQLDFEFILASSDLQPVSLALRPNTWAMNIKKLQVLKISAAALVSEEAGNQKYIGK